MSYVGNCSVVLVSYIKSECQEDIKKVYPENLILLMLCVF